MIPALERETVSRRLRVRLSVRVDVQLGGWGRAGKCFTLLNQDAVRLF